MYFVLGFVQARLWGQIQETNTVGLLTSVSLTVLQEKVKRLLIESWAPLHRDPRLHPPVGQQHGIIQNQRQLDRVVESGNM